METISYEEFIECNVMRSIELEEPDKVELYLAWIAGLLENLILCWSENFKGVKIWDCLIPFGNRKKQRQKDDVVYLDPETFKNVLQMRLGKGTEK